MSLTSEERCESAAKELQVVVAAVRKHGHHSLANLVDNIIQTYLRPQNFDRDDAVVARDIRAARLTYGKNWSYAEFAQSFNVTIEFVVKALSGRV